MARVVWTPAALRDVARLHAFLAVANREAARRAVQSIRHGARALGEHPQLGRLIEDMPPEFRERITPFGSSAYVTLYHYDGTEVVILAVRHGRESGFN